MTIQASGIYTPLAVIPATAMAARVRGGDNSPAAQLNLKSNAEYCARAPIAAWSCDARLCVDSDGRMYSHTFRIRCAARWPVHARLVGCSNRAAARLVISPEQSSWWSVIHEDESDTGDNCPPTPAAT